MNIYWSDTGQMFKMKYSGISNLKLMVKIN